MSPPFVQVRYRRWWPIVTRCPANGWPDVLHVTVETVQRPEQFIDLYEMRRELGRFSGRTLYMEELAQQLAETVVYRKRWAQTAVVTVRTWFSSHVVTYAIAKHETP
jgi:hypothetical protein